MGAEGHDPAQRHDEERETYERLALPLLIPATVILFAILVIYGLSRIYLELDQWSYKDVSMATPAAIGVAIFILLAAAYLASRPRVSAIQIALIGAVALGFLTGGSIWAAVHEDKPIEHAGGPSPTPGGTPTEGGVQAELSEFSVTANPESAPAGPTTFNVTNAGTLIHNFRAVKTDLAPDELPLDDSGFQVDEAQLDVLAETDEVPAGESATAEAELAAGAYVLFCNIPTHYEQGMHTAFAVE